VSNPSDSAIGHVLRFLRAEADGYEAEAQKAAAQQRYEAAGRFASKAAVLRYVIGRIERGDHLTGD
jgi:hypothetical protein